LISIALRSGLSVDAIIDQIRGIRCPACIRREGVNVTSCPDAISKVIKKYMDVGGNEEGNQVHAPGKDRDLSEVLHKFSSAAAKSGEYVKNIPVNGLTKRVNTGIAIDQACPECGMPINHESGCVVCTHCGFSKCG
jgi:ribonucleoside-diphosphate reductase alpha chain